MHTELINRFLVKWVLYTSFGWLLAQAAGIFIAHATFPEAELAALPTSPLYFAVFGFFFGLSQWLCIRDRLPNSFGWVIATAIGCFAAALTLKVLHQFEMSNSFLKEFPFIGYFFGGMMIGFAQYQTIKKIFRKANWWIIVIAVSWVMAQGFIGVANAAVALLGVFVFATITGLTLVWLVQNPAAEIQAA